MLKVPKWASQDPKRVRVRVTVGARTFFLKVAKTIGKADILLTCLKSEEPVVGKFYIIIVYD